MWNITTSDAYVITISTASTAATSTYTITFSGSSPKEPEKPKPKPVPTLEECLATMKFSEPEVLPPKRYGTCGRCCVEVDYDAFGGTCSVCGRMLMRG